jgi:hypothetical protein
MGYWDKIDAHWDRLNDAKTETETWTRAVGTGPADVIYLFSVHWCFAEVGNGGLLQFFSNNTGIMAPEAVDGFRAIGMPEAADLLNQAMALLGGSYPRDWEERHAALYKVMPEEDLEDVEPEDLFEDLEDRFWDLMEPKEGEGFEARADAWAAGR